MISYNGSTTADLGTASKIIGMNNDFRYKIYIIFIYTVFNFEDLEDAARFNASEQNATDVKYFAIGKLKC